jgi:phosphatidylserine decarboxylase
MKRRSRITSATSNFNHFFTRALAEWCATKFVTEGVCCPADGQVSQAGDHQARTHFSGEGAQLQHVQELLGGDEQLAALFDERFVCHGVSLAA